MAEARAARADDFVQAELNEAQSQVNSLQAQSNELKKRKADLQ